MKKEHIELEAHFLNVDPVKIHAKLMDLGAVDKGEDILQEIIFYDKDSTWQKQSQFVRLRRNKEYTTLTYKHFQYEDENLGPSAKPVVKEIETQVESWENTQLILQSIGLVAFREQEKKRHSYLLKNVIVDIDTWPTVPPYVEIEGDSIESIEAVAALLGFDMKDAIYRGASYIINHFYNIPVKKYKYFTFSKLE